MFRFAVEAYKLGSRAKNGILHCWHDCLVCYSLKESNGILQFYHEKLETLKTCFYVWWLWLWTTFIAPNNKISLITFLFIRFHIWNFLCLCKLEIKKKLHGKEFKVLLHSPSLSSPNSNTNAILSTFNLVVAFSN